MPNCALNDCHHKTFRDREACLRKLRTERLIELDTKERLIREERIQILLGIERENDLPMPGHEHGSTNCQACRALQRG